MKRSLSLWHTLSRGSLVAAAVTMLAGSVGMARAAENPGRSRKPNIVLILADDMGWRTWDAAAARSARRLTSMPWHVKE